MIFYSNNSECVVYNIVPFSSQCNMHYVYSIVVEVREKQLHCIITKHLTHFREYV